MQAYPSKKAARNFFLLSLLLHLLFIVGVTTVITLQPVQERQKSPHLYVPSYVYKGAITPVVSRKSVHSTQASNDQASRKVEDHFHQTEQAKFSEDTQSLANRGTSQSHQKSILQMSRDMIRQDQMQEAVADHENIEPILLIGDKSVPADPLIRLMGRALSANLIYPKIEEYLDSRARVLVAFVLHPEGNFTNVQVVKSSDNTNFDNAALYAVNKAPNIPGARRFLPKPKYFVVGFIFDSAPPQF